MIAARDRGQNPTKPHYLPRSATRRPPAWRASGHGGHSAPVRYRSKHSRQCDLLFTTRWARCGMCYESVVFSRHAKDRTRLAAMPVTWGMPRAAGWPLWPAAMAVGQDGAVGGCGPAAPGWPGYSPRDRAAASASSARSSNSPSITPSRNASHSAGVK